MGGSAGDEKSSNRIWSPLPILEGLTGGTVQSPPQRSTSTEASPIADEALFVPMGRVLATVSGGMNSSELIGIARSLVPTADAAQINRALMRMKDLNWISITDELVTLTASGVRFIDAVVSSNRTSA